MFYYSQFIIWILFKWDENGLHFFFFLFFGGPWSELLEESESESEEDDEEDELELSSLSLLLSSDEDEELEESLLSEEESLEELEESLLLPELEEDLFFFVFFSLCGTIPGPVSSKALLSVSFSFFFISAVLDGR